MKKLLPLGSVVLLEGGVMKLMVIGRLQINKGDGQLFDYAGLAYPYGLAKDEKVFLFNHEDINVICFKGYENEEEAEFQIALGKFIEQSGLYKQQDA